jgi:long-chain fatty acid transport protein
MRVFHLRITRVPRVFPITRPSHRVAVEKTGITSIFLTTVSTRRALDSNGYMMLTMNKYKSRFLPLLLVFSAAMTTHGQGPVITGVGPVNRSMGGAGTAAPLEAIGAIHWNPGSIRALDNSELSFGVELLDVNVDLSSTIGGVTNSTSGDAGIAPVPTIGWVHHIEDTPLSIGLGVNAIAGFKNNLPNDPGNPLLAAGPAFASAEFLQIAPTLAYACTDRLSIGVAPTVTTATLTLNPIGPSFITPIPTPGSGNRMHWGGGVQIGAYYSANSAWKLGFTYKSRQWFETFNFFAPGGTVRFDLDYPMILSFGTAFTGLENWTIAADARYLDFENADGFKDLGFSSVFAFAIGTQYRMTDRLYLRAGYNFNANPIHDDDVFTNVITPLIQEQNLAVGGSLRLGCQVDINAAYVHLFENTVSGPLPSPPIGPPNTMSNTLSADSLLLGVTVRY